MLFLPFTVLVLSRLWNRLIKGNPSERIATVGYFLHIGASAAGTLLIVLFPFLESKSLAGLRYQVFPFRLPIIAQPLPAFWYFVDTMIY